VAAGVPNANPPPRQRFKTLVGLFPEDLGSGPSAAQASAPELFEDSLPAEGSAVMEAATPASHVDVYDDEDEDDTIRGEVYEDNVRDDDTQDEADSDEVEVGDEELDDAHDAPTQAYNVAQFADVAREARGQLESGPRLASRPPPASEDVFSAPAQSPWQARGQAPASAGPGAAAESNLADLFDQEYTMPAAQAVPSSGHTPVAIAAAVAVAPATVQAPIPVQTAAQPPAPATKPDRRLLMLTMFFAGTTVALAIVALGLVVRSQSAEQAASALADAPAQHIPTNLNVPVAPAPAPVAAPAPAPAPPAVAPPEPPVTAESPATSEATEPSEKDPAPAAATEAATAEGMDATVRAEPTAAPVAPSPTPRAVRRAAPRKPRTPQRYVPSDI